MENLKRPPAWFAFPFLRGGEKRFESRLSSGSRGFFAVLLAAAGLVRLETDDCELRERNERAERLLNRCGTKILRLAYSYLHNMADAEEVLQDTFVQLLKTNPSFADETHEIAWLMRVAGNLSKNRIRYNQYRVTDELNDELIAEEREDLSFVWEAVKSLPVQYREVIHMYYYEGYSTAQIAEILQKNESTVRSCLARGRARLKSILKEEYDFETTV
ncbi:MAG: sigma-70 family RNA polymerase sigma factor [Clostridia bacterium]|nr:sigma-70 family RNA polymerase sigma factor [Clostridia bacterium]